ncbi:MAG: isoleucine--tRNA ligase [Bdellovibrionales bacterium]|nr:isoleucine--tRNA ligase [Bdellovibrionales bacterium]
METVSPNVDFVALEKKTLLFWREQQIFSKSLDRRKDSPQYRFYDGPPFATGTPHYGHLLAGTIKDIVPRYQTMLGNYVERRFGWDTHGLPIEMLTEKEIGLNGRKEILEYGIDRFNEACRSGVLRYVSEWEKVTERLGRWIDFVNDYKTMDLSFMDSVWWVFKQLWDQGRVYEGARVVPYSWRLSTPLSNFEASSNYKTVQDPAITVRFRSEEDPNCSFLAWTTTPWTLPSNLGLCIGPDIPYVRVKEVATGEELILAEARLPHYFPKTEAFEILERPLASSLVGKRYRPLFPFYEELASEGAFRIVSDSYVTTEDGTGVVHQSPAHGEDDYRVSVANGIPLVDPVDEEGRFTEKAGPLQGLNIKEADKTIIGMLKETGLLFRQETITHSYPFCERSDTPLIYKAISAWYVRVEDMREAMLENNRAIHWIPEHIREGRFGNWLAQARDWNISRNRYWGNPLPIWRCDSCDHIECLGSYKDLEERANTSVTDLHKHYVDTLMWKCPNCSGTCKRVPEVLDCWFESGSMPYAQIHYPFENKEKFESSFPADFIAEGLDQTRGWFYTLMILSTALFKKAPFQNVIVNGMILAEDGKKMSKRLRNYPDPLDVMDTYGSDALRLYLISSPAVRGESLRFSEAGVKDIVRSILLPFWNVYSFFTTYANVDQYQPSQVLTESSNILDRWILSRFQTLLSAIETEMSAYRLYAVIPQLLGFLEELTNWYLRRSRRRFWEENPTDKQHGYDTLLYILSEFSKALAPFLPFITDEIYQNLSDALPSSEESVHLCSYPQADKALTDSTLEESMSLIQTAVALGRALRAKHNLKVRQPLQSLTVVTKDERAKEILETYGSHILEELNVKEVLFSNKEKDLVNISVKPNFPKLGPIFGKEMKQCAKELSELSLDQIVSLESGNEIEILGRKLTVEVLEVRREAKSGVPIETAKGVTVFFDMEISPELRAEGLAREVINRIQRMRKDAGLEITDRISAWFRGSTDLSKAIENNREYIQQETLSLALQGTSSEVKDADVFYQEHKIDQDTLDLWIKKTAV